MKRVIKTIVLVLAVMMLTACGGKKIESQNELKSFAIAALKDGKYEEALSGFDEALGLAGGRVTAREIDICYYKAVTQFLMEDVASACETLDNVINYDDKNADAFYLRGSIYLSEGEYDKAFADYKSSVAIDPTDYERVIRVFSDLDGNGQRDAGLSIVSSALSSLSDTDEDQMWKGRFYLLLEQYDNALDAFTRAEGAGFKEAEVYLAQVLVQQGDTAGAREKIASYVASEAPTVEGLATAGEQYMAMEEYESAYDCFEKAVSFYQSDDEKEAPKDLSQETYRRLLSDRVAACEFLGEWSDALKFAREYIALYPQDERMLTEIKFLATR